MSSVRRSRPRAPRRSGWCAPALAARSSRPPNAHNPSRLSRLTENSGKRSDYAVRRPHSRAGFRHTRACRRSPRLNRTCASREINVTRFEVKAIGRVGSSLTELQSAPRQADEGAPEAWLFFEPEVLEGLRNLRPGDAVIVLTWLDRARRDVLSVGILPRRRRACSAHALRAAQIPSACTGWRSPPSTATACGCAISKRWMGRRSSTSSRYSAKTSDNASQWTGRSVHR
jgi:hypothetical protein